MDDLISRQAALKAIDNLPRSYRTKEHRARVAGYADVAMVIEDLPSVERREVVRCKCADCTGGYCEEECLGGKDDDEE